MKYIFIAISLLFTLTPVYSQMEFEEVFNTSEFGPYANMSKFKFASDTMLYQLYYINTLEGNQYVEYYIKIRNQEPVNITDKLTKHFSSNSQYDTLGYFHPKLSQFIRYEKSDTTIYYIDLNGDIVRKIKYPHNNLDFGQLFMNSNDESFLGIYHEYEQSLTDTYYHDIVYTTNYGETWNQINPEQFVYEQTGTLYNTHRAIDAFFSSKNNGKMLIRFYWSSKFEDHFEYTFYDYYSQKFKMYDNWFNPEEVVCYECHREDYLSLFDSYLELRNETDSFNYLDFEKITRYNQDSLSSIGERVYLPFIKNVSNASYLVNRLNVRHHIMALDHYVNNMMDGEQPDRLLFQTFDGGNNWEFVYKDTNRESKISLISLNPFTNELWLGRPIFDDENVGYRYGIVYKSISPLTNVENQEENLGLNLLLNKYSLNIVSENQYINTQISLYDLEGKILFNKALSITKGNNYLEIPELQNKLILVAIKTKNGDEVFKLLNTN